VLFLCIYCDEDRIEIIWLVYDVYYWH